MSSILENKLETVNNILKSTIEHPGANGEREFVSGEIVEPGVYVDVESGVIVRVAEPDELPDGRMVMRYDRRFRKIESDNEIMNGTVKAA